MTDAVPPASAPLPPRPRHRLTWLLAAALTLVLSLVWSIQNWPSLAALRLPDNDDAARLAQVRDWLNGQAFNDLMQYRFGPAEGASMHWSRLADLGPAALILMLRPLLGTHAAELAAAIAYPALLFFAYLLLAATIAARLAGEAARVPALVLAALAFPTISLFLPGRIDHHGLQIVLTLLLLYTLVAPPGLRRGALGGLATAASLAIGLETAPEIVAALGVAGLAWLRGGRDEDRHMAGFGAALCGATLLLLAFARPRVWPAEWCDGFTPASSSATLILAAALMLMGLSGRWAPGWRMRLPVAALLGLATAALAWRTSAVCLAGPYGPIDPFLQHVWMRNVGEARGLFTQETAGAALAYGGLILVGTVLALARLRHDPRWLGFALFMLLGAVASVLQIRVTYIMAGVAAVPVAATLARTTGLGKRLALWVAGAGIVWNLAAIRFDLAFAAPAVLARHVQEKCVEPGPLRAIARYPAGTIMAPLDLDSYLLSMTPHHPVGSYYHRNNAGNLAMYRFFLSPPERAREQAKAQGVAYVALCVDQMREDGMAPYRPGSLVERLQSDAPPPEWLERLPAGGAVRFYRVR
jgi:hypothetical protein